MLNCPLCQCPDTVTLALVNERRYWRCGECRLVFLSLEQRPDAQAERQRYLQHRNSPDDPDYRAFLSRLSSHLVPCLPPGASGLDYGCGPGPTLSVMLEEQGFNMQLYDPFFAPDPSVLESTYDFITCTETTEHFHSPAREFQQLDSMLKEGGWLGVMTELLDSDAQFEGWWYHRDFTHVCFYRRETMEWIARRFGWEVAFPRKNVILFQKGQRQAP